MQAQGFSTWQGNWKEGAGTLSTFTDTLHGAPYSYASRFDGAPGASPEELLATAHAGCFNQALANNFGMQALSAQTISTAVSVELGKDELGRPAILGVHIRVEARVAGATPAQFEQCAERARSNCAISKVLRCDITMSAHLLD